MTVQQFNHALCEDGEPETDWADHILHGQPVPTAADRSRDRRRREWENDLMNDIRFVRCEVTGVEAFDDKLITLHPDDNPANERITVLTDLLEEEELFDRIDSDYVSREIFDAVVALKELPDIASGAYRESYYIAHGDPWELPDSAE